MEDKKTIVKMAFVYFQEGRWDKAIAEYRKLLNMDPADLNAHNMLGDALVKKGEFKEAYKEYSAVADAYNQQGLMDKANVVFKKMAKFDSAHLDDSAKGKQQMIQQRVKAETAAETGNVEEAIAAFRLVLKNDPEDFYSRQKLAELCETTGKTQEAIKEYEVISNAFYSNRMLKKAMVTFQKILQLDPNHVEAHATLGDIYAKEGMESEAKKEFLSVAEVYANQGQLDKALVNCQKAIQLKSIEANYLLGVIYFKRGMLDDARTALETLLKFKVNHKGALMIVGQIHATKGRIEDAVAAYNKILKTEPDNSEVQLALGKLYAEKGSSAEALAQYLAAADNLVKESLFDKAQEACEKAISAGPESADAHKKLSEILVQRDMKKDAAREMLWLGNYYQTQQDSAKAKEFFQTAYKYDPQNPDARSKAGAAPVAAPSTPAAPPPPTPSVAPAPSVAQPVAAPAAAPSQEQVTNLLVCLKLGDTFASMGLDDKAVEQYQKALMLDPSHAEATQKLAALLAKKPGAEISPAVPALDSALEAQKKQEEEARLALEQRQREDAARRETEARQAEEARAHQAAEAAKVQPSATSSEDIPPEFITPTVAGIYEKQGQIKGALGIYRKLLEKEPDNAAYKTKIVELSEKLGGGSAGPSEPAPGPSGPSSGPAGPSVPSGPAITPSPSSEGQAEADTKQAPKKGRVSYV